MDDETGDMVAVVTPYVMDLNSTNGAFGGQGSGFRGEVHGLGFRV